MGAIDRRADSDAVSPREGAGDLPGRLIGAALRCVSRWGFAKTTLDDVAREAGCSRATVYRAFPGGKDALFGAVVSAEIGRLEARVADAVTGAEDLEDALVEGITTLGRAIDEHAALQHLLAHEPGLVLPHFAFRELDALLARVADVGTPLLGRFAASDEDAARLAEWAARIVISHTCSPSAGVRLRDAGSIRSLVRTFVLPGLLVHA